MLQSMNLPLSHFVRNEYGGCWEGLREDCAALGLDGVEGIWDGEDIPADFPRDLLTGYHLTFFSDWLDFYREDWPALLRKFGSREAVSSYYGGTHPDVLLAGYRADLERARMLGARYVVFHVSDISIEEGYTYRWFHSDEAVVDAAVEIINCLLDGQEWPFEFLVENQWWPGFTFTEPAKTSRLLEGIHFPAKGILLDTGHLMNTDPWIKNQASGLTYIEKMLDLHGTSLCNYIRGVHLHQSLSGIYVRQQTGMLPQDLPKDYMERFCVSYAHILQIDRHRPWTNPNIARLFDRISPQYLTHELRADGRRERCQTVKRQIYTLKKGDFALST